jgi:hypothetical protein
MSRDIHAEVTASLVAAIEANPGDPIMPWHRGGASELPVNIASGAGLSGRQQRQPLGHLPGCRSHMLRLGRVASVARGRLPGPARRDRRAGRVLQAGCARKGRRG